MIFVVIAKLFCEESCVCRYSICAGRSVWFAGKYTIISYELVVLVLAWYSLKYGKPIPFNLEFALHVGIALIGVLVSVTFAAECNLIWKRAGLLHTSSPTYEQSINASLAKKWYRQYNTSLEQYNNLMSNYLRVWAGLLTFVVITWAIVRIVLHKLLKSLHRDLLAVTDVSKVQRLTLSKLHEAKRNLFFKVIKPLEPYVVVFVVFGFPTIVMSTHFCTKMSRTYSDHKPWGCMLPCEWLQSFRAIALVIIYFFVDDNYTQAAGLPYLYRRIRQRYVQSCLPVLRQVHARVHGRERSTTVPLRVS
eukprot:m.162455 g.162455  ORF g.162455 m.162455 type:complete len:305 (-) comp18069_c0_seq7:95-1009(-)